MTKCDICGRDFATDAALAQHRKDKHGSEGERPPEDQKEARRKSKGKSLRRRNRHPVAIGLAAVALVAALGLYLVVAPSFAPTPVPCTTGENWIHVHPYLSITIEGTSVAVPDSIGFLRGGSCLEVMHTHDKSGIIHIELAQSDANANYTLSDFFRVWNATYPNVSINGSSHPVVFSNTNIFGFKTDGTHKLLVLVDGKAVSDGVNAPLKQLDYCNSTNGGVPPCAATARGDPLWNGSSNYPYGTGHTIVIEYIST